MGYGHRRWVRAAAAWVTATSCARDVAPVEDDVVGPDTDALAFAFAFPLAAPERFEQVVGVDHDPDVYTSTLLQVTCEDYLGRGFPHCYDEHRGSDFILLGGFEAMDAGSPEVIAGAEGVVIGTADGNYDRCHATLEGVDCDGHPRIANSVTVDHGGGVVSRYLHLMNGSVLVEVGDPVVRGTPLGRVGSSGNSSMPHLHFEVQQDGVAFDPYAGPRSQARSWWCDQGDPDGLPGPCEGAAP